jgi:hypothetical protein
MTGKSDAADFAASLAAAAAATGDEPDGDGDVGSADVDDDTADAAPASVGDDAGDSSDPLDAPDTADADDGEDASEDDGANSGDDVDLAAIGQDILAGNVDDAFAALAPLLKIDPKVFSVTGPKLKAMREGLAETKKLKLAADSQLEAAKGEKAKADQILAGARQQYGWAVDLKQAIAIQDWYAVKELCEGLAPKGTNWETIAGGVVAAARGVSPSEVLYRQKLRDLQRKEQEQAEAAAAATATQTAVASAAEIQQKNVAGATAKLKGTEFEGIEEAAETLAKIVADSYDAKRGGFTITFAGAMEKLKADKVVAKLVKLKKLEASRAPRTPVTPPRQPDGKFRTANGKKPPGRKPSKEEEFAASIALAAAAEAANSRFDRIGRRGSRGGK